MGAAEAVKQAMELLADGDYGTGLCLGCGAEAYNVEPDARRYTCEDCGQAKVYGAEEIILMGGEEL